MFSKSNVAQSTCQRHETLAQCSHGVVRDGVDADPGQPQQRRIQSLAKPVSAGQPLRRQVRARKARRWRAQASRRHRRGIANLGYSVAGDGVATGDELGNTLGLIRVQLAQFIQRTWRRATARLLNGVEQRWQGQQR